MMNLICNKMMPMAYHNTNKQVCFECALRPIYSYGQYEASQRKVNFSCWPCNIIMEHSVAVVKNTLHWREKKQVMDWRAEWEGGHFAFNCGFRINLYNAPAHRGPGGNRCLIVASPYSTKWLTELIVSIFGTVSSGMEMFHMNQPMWHIAVHHIPTVQRIHPIIITGLSLKGNGIHEMNEDCRPVLLWI